ncbi:TonB-dependent receptor [Paracidobacterium acidisoli]|nr:carboxypeptidase regulatory-like domain-containing protein [Paracidobacterium acidisoli]MBT9332562.1 carboxypeptidase regulatory-like domain-containing protein [Paracidobacterium acidisoli]
MLALLLAFIFPFLSPYAFGQADTSAVSGTVTDPSGAVIPKAKVTAHNDATGADRTALTNGSGYYTVTNLPTGVYTIRVEASGFQTAVLSGNRLDPNIGSRVDASLKTGSTSSTVTVEADANVLQTESAAAGQLVTSDQVKTIQLNGRNPLYLSQLEPGVTRNASISAFNFSPDFSGPTINGARSNESVLTLDGAPMVRTRADGTQVGVADVDSTSQVQILTTGYPAEYGGTSGGQIRMVPKSGTGTYHGTVYEYLRNSFFNANTWAGNDSNQPSIADHPPAFRYNQFGWNLNGPVTIPHHFNTSRQKLFFLAGQEYIRYRQSPTKTGIVPTTLMRQGNFSELLAPNIFYKNPVQLVDPNTGQDYPNNNITNGLSPNGLALLNAYPAPNANNSGFNWQEEAAYPQNQRKDTLVIDYIPADAHHLRFSLLNYNYYQDNPFAGNFDRTPQIWNWPNQVAVLHYTWTINPTTVNEATFSASADHVTITDDLTSGRYNRTNYGINYPYIYPASQKLIQDKIPTIEIANFTTLDGGPYPSHSGGPIFNLMDNFTKVIGTHTLKAGVLWQYSGENNFDQISVSSTTPGSTNNQNGQFIFTDTRTGHPTSNAAVGNAALGLFDTYGEIGQKSYTLFRGNMWEGFVQDSWQATSKAVVEFGVRYSVMQPYYAPWGNQSVFSQSSWDPALAPNVDPNTGALSGGDPLNGVVIPGSHFPSAAKGHVPDSIIGGQYNRLFRGFGRGYSKTTWTNIQPRVGFTWQVAPLTVFRIGGGRFVQRLGISDQVQLGGNAPFQPSSTVTAGSVDNPGAAGLNSLPLSLSSQAYIFPDPNAWAWNVAVEQEIPDFATFTIQYVGRRGLHLSQLENVNQLRPGTVQANPGVKAPDALRPYRGFSAILEDSNRGSSIYHAMQIDLKRRMTKNLLFGVAYTWSKSMDFGSSTGYELPNMYDASPNYGPSDFDIRNVLVVNYVWDIPYGSHLSNRFERGAFGNWEISGTTQAQSGEPFSVGTGDDFAGVGPAAGEQLWVMTKKPTVFKNFVGHGNGYWFDPTAFAPPAPGTLAPRGTRNEIYSPGFQSWNIAMLKSFHVIPGHDNHVLAFKAEAFNFTNHPNFDTPSNDSGMDNPTSGTFGQVTQKGNTYASDRELQFSLRYEF